jgi:hypothetical protein
MARREQPVDLSPQSLLLHNESIGGPFNSSKHLLGSNVDWGQDLRYLQTLIKSRSPFKIQLAYSSSFDPRWTGFSECLPIENSRDERDAVLNQPGLVTGYYAVSLNLLCGAMQDAYDGRRGIPLALSPYIIRQLSAFASNRVGSAGYSISVLRIPSFGDSGDKAGSGFDVVIRAMSQ